MLFAVNTVYCGQTGIIRENVHLHDLQISTRLIWMRITTVSVKFLRRVEGLKRGKRKAITFCVKLKKTSTKT
jgi:hypothetical protein